MQQIIYFTFPVKKNVKIKITQKKTSQLCGFGLVKTNNQKLQMLSIEKH